MKFLIISAVAIAAIILVAYAFLRSPKTIDKSLETYHGKISEYRGNKKLIAAFTASWASVWKMSAEELRKLNFNNYDLVIVDDAVNHQEVTQFGINFMPTIALIEHGKITKSIQNLSSIDQIKDW